MLLVSCQWNWISWIYLISYNLIKFIFPTVTCSLLKDTLYLLQHVILIIHCWEKLIPFWLIHYYSVTSSLHRDSQCNYCKSERYTLSITTRDLDNTLLGKTDPVLTHYSVTSSLHRDSQRNYCKSDVMEV